MLFFQLDIEKYRQGIENPIHVRSLTRGIYSGDELQHCLDEPDNAVKVANNARRDKNTKEQLNRGIHDGKKVDDKITRPSSERICLSSKIAEVNNRITSIHYEVSPRRS